jgi:hypothetical protein
MGSQESKFREATTITEELRIKILRELQAAERSLKEITKVVSATRHEPMNSVDFLLVLTELFETLGRILGMTHPNSYLELLTNQFEIAKNGIHTCSTLRVPEPRLSREISSDMFHNHSPIMRRRSTRPKVNLLDLTSLQPPLRSSKTERGWFDFSQNQVLCVENIIRSCYTNSDRQKFPNARQYCHLFLD